MILKITNLHARITDTDKQILNGINLEIEQGTVHALMGPNGSGKSTLGHTLMGHPAYQVTKGKAVISPSLGKRGKGSSLLDLDPHERAAAGLFLAFQHPITIPGVPLANFLRASYEQLHGTPTTSRGGLTENKSSISALDFFKHLKLLAQHLHIPEDFLRRPINDGLSGGERKKLETLQILALRPKFIILDELDTGTDVDALKRIGETIHQLATQGYDSFSHSREGGNPVRTKTASSDIPAILIITHYNRIFNYIQPHHVHIIKAGRIVKSGTYSLVDQIETSGYDQF